MKNNLEQLESAIRQQAENIANSHLQAAQQQAEQILAESAKRLRQREEREREIAQAAADQEYRRRVQASEIKMQAELDQLRWSLVQSVLSDLQVQLKQLRQEDETYLLLLKQYLKNAAQLFDEKALVIEVNAEDQVLLAPLWEDIIKEIVPDKTCTLLASSKHFTGGLLVRNQVDRIRVDNTFEGLIERLKNDLYQVITTHLFASVTSIRNL
jgi:V/A-type H+-transporting ATPase subunit E